MHKLEEECNLGEYNVIFQLKLDNSINGNVRFCEGKLIL